MLSPLEGKAPEPKQVAGPHRRPPLQRMVLSNRCWELYRYGRYEKLEDPGGWGGHKMHPPARVTQVVQKFYAHSSSADHVYRREVAPGGRTQWLLTWQPTSQTACRSLEPGLMNLSNPVGKITRAGPDLLTTPRRFQTSNDVPLHARNKMLARRSFATHERRTDRTSSRPNDRSRHTASW